MMRFLAIGLRAVAAPLRLLPQKQQVALLSRQSGKLSMDFRFLKDELEHAIGPDRVRVHIMKPEMAGKGAFLMGTLAQLGIAARSKVIVADGYLPAVCIPPKRPGCTIIQMWHAPGAIKKFGHQCLDTPAGRTSEAAREAHMHENYDYIVAGGTGAVPAYAEAFGYDESVIKAFGLPHFDYLLDTSPEGARMQKAQAIAQEHPFFTEGKLNILYAPTLRKGEGYDNWLTNYVQQLIDCCPAEQANLIVAGHPLDHNMDQGLYERYPNLHFVPHTATVDLLELADCVISDYSTVALSAGLLNKPVLYFVPDIEPYSASPGLNVDLMGDDRIFASADASELMGAALDPAALERTRAEHNEFIGDYFANDCTHVSERIAAFVVDLLETAR